MKLILRNDKASLIRRTGHPWIYRSAILDNGEQPENGSLVDVCDEKNDRVGFGFYSSESKIACRMISFQLHDLEGDWVLEKIREAARIRNGEFIRSNAFRLVNAEGDYFPGLIIDVYNMTVVVRPAIRGVELLLSQISDALLTLFPQKRIFLKRDERAARVEKLEHPGGYVSGSGDGTEVIEEDGLSFNVDIREGQKTGFYLDQRENRGILKNYVKGKRVLNLFCYTGGFSLSAAAGGAAAIDSVDTSAAALHLAEKNLRENFGETGDNIRWIREDAFSFLGTSGSYDVIVCDPPPFARTRGELRGALAGYRRLHESAFKRLAADGYLLTFSCSQAVNGDMLKEILFQAAGESPGRIRIVKTLHAGFDHPVSLFHPEGEYLKGFIVNVQ